jgi:hypothetical protein
MKTYTITFSIQHILGALFLAVGTLAIYSFQSPEDSVNENQIFDTGITLQQAKTMYQANANSATPYGGGLTAVTISPQMVDALEKVKKKSSNAQGFRCYFAKGENGQKMSIMVGVDSDGKDDVTFIKSADAANFDGCPPLCDMASPITN